MIDRKGTTVFNKGKKIKSFDNVEDAESFKNALSMTDINNGEEIIEKKSINKLYTSINEFKQYLNESINDDEISAIIEDNKDVIFSTVLKHFNDIFKSKDFKNINTNDFYIVENLEVNLDIYQDINKENNAVIFNTNKYPDLKNIEIYGLEFTALGLDSEYKPGWGTGNSWHDDDGEDSDLNSVDVIDNTISITVYVFIYNVEYPVTTMEVKLSDYLDTEALEALGNFIYDQYSEEIREYLDENFEPDFYNPYD